MWNTRTRRPWPRANSAFSLTGGLTAVSIRVRAFYKPLSESREDEEEAKSPGPPTAKEREAGGGDLDNSPIRWG